QEYAEEWRKALYGDSPEAPPWRLKFARAFLARPESELELLKSLVQGAILDEPKDGLPIEKDSFVSAWQESTRSAVAAALLGLTDEGPPPQEYAAKLFFNNVDQSVKEVDLQTLRASPQHRMAMCWPILWDRLCEKESLKSELGP